MRQILGLCLISFMLSSCLTNREHYAVEDNDYWSDRYYKEEQSSEKTNFAGYLIAIGAAAALVVAAGLEGTTR